MPTYVTPLGHTCNDLRRGERRVIPPFIVPEQRRSERRKGGTINAEDECAGNKDSTIKVRCQSYEASEQSQPCPRGHCVMAQEDDAPSEGRTRQGGTINAAVVADGQASHRLTDNALASGETGNAAAPDHRVSPAVGEWAIEELAKLRTDNERLAEALDMIRVYAVQSLDSKPEYLTHICDRIHDWATDALKRPISLQDQAANQRAIVGDAMGGKK